MTSETAQTVPAGWDGILDPGETILWQGRPDGKVIILAKNIVTLLFGLFFGGFALFWVVMAGAMGGGMFALFGVPHFLVGAGIVWGAIYWGPYKQRRTWYTLTDRRALIATELPIRGRRLKSWPINPDTPIDFQPGPPASVFFASEMKRGEHSSYQVPIGFERIEDGDTVYRLIRSIQTETP